MMSQTTLHKVRNSIQVSALTPLPGAGFDRRSQEYVPVFRMHSAYDLQAHPAGIFVKAIPHKDCATDGVQIFRQMKQKAE